MKTLREELQDRNLLNTDDAILVHDGCCDMMVSGRYLSGGWDNVLNKKVKVLGTIGREFQTVED